MKAKQNLERGRRARGPSKRSPSKRLRVRAEPARPQAEGSGMKRWTQALGVAAILAMAALLAASGWSRRVAEATEPASGAATALVLPPRPAATEMSRLRDGLSAASSGDWAGVRTLRAGASDALVRRILDWRYASDRSAPLSFSELATALNTFSDWPGRATMRQRAEQAIFDSALLAQQRIDFLGQDDGPLTGDGKIALAAAYADLGRRSEATAIARGAWRDNALTPRAEDEALARFGSALTADDHAARVDLLLWRGERSAASRLSTRLSSSQQALTRARIALQTRQRRGLQAAVDAVPAALRDAPGLLYDRTQYIRRTGRPEVAISVAAQIRPTDAPPATRDDIFAERRLYVSRAMKARDYPLAYRLVADHGMTSGAAFADAEWLAGWLALRFTNQPTLAAGHFTHLDENVSTPVSRSRALYWRAQAAKALGNRDESNARLTEAARYDFAFYGQLAAAERDPNHRITLPNDGPPSREVRQRFENREVVRALRLIAEVGSQRDFESVAYYLDDALDNADELELLSELAREQSFMRTAVRSAKAGLHRGIVAPNSAYPLIPLPDFVQTSTRPEPALVLAIIRQESEFDPNAVSSVGARGLMQLMPATARLTANRYGMSYDGPAALNANTTYNITLGARHLSDLLDSFNGSYVLTIAAYNAGPGRAREWIEEWGDPRARSVDVVDWIELIPFSETRNYVQRVLENVQVYRHRLSGAPAPLMIEQDLRRGG
ncbi:MAG: transglycosylase SLT domain-containing protein [Alphaproteobacteria bacterium]|nr:transglycosylase SLT domain-containing protein [Alphaproteobacteria bacterium]